MKRKSNLFLFSAASRTFSIVSFTPAIFKNAITREEIKLILENLYTACENFGFLETPNFASVLFVVIFAIILTVLLLQDVGGSPVVRTVLYFLLFFDLLVGVLIGLRIKRYYDWARRVLDKFDEYISKVNTEILNPRDLKMIHWSYFKALELIKVEDEKQEFHISIGRVYQRPAIKLESQEKHTIGASNDEDIIKVPKTNVLHL
jgi:hypothetical protein